MSTELLVGILILLLVVGVPLVQAAVRAVQRRRSLGLDGVAALRAAGLRRGELPAGLTPQSAEAVTSEDIALADDNPEASIRQLDESGRLIGYRESYRDPRSLGEFLDWVGGQTLYRRRAHRRLELELTRYETAAQAADAVEAAARLDPTDAEVEVQDIGTADGVLAREWTRAEQGAPVQRMLELRWASGDVLAVVRGDAEPSGALADADVRRAAALVKGRLS